MPVLSFFQSCYLLFSSRAFSNAAGWPLPSLKTSRVSAPLSVIISRPSSSNDPRQWRRDREFPLSITAARRRRRTFFSLQFDNLAALASGAPPRRSSAQSLDKRTIALSRLTQTSRGLIVPRPHSLQPDRYDLISPISPFYWTIRPRRQERRICDIVGLRCRRPRLYKSQWIDTATEIYD